MCEWSRGRRPETRQGLLQTAKQQCGPDGLELAPPPFTCQVADELCARLGCAGYQGTAGLCTASAKGRPLGGAVGLTGPHSARPRGFSSPFPVISGTSAARGTSQPLLVAPHRGDLLWPGGGSQSSLKETTSRKTVGSNSGWKHLAFKEDFEPQDFQCSAAPSTASVRKCFTTHIPQDSESPNTFHVFQVIWKMIHYSCCKLVIVQPVKQMMQKSAVFEEKSWASYELNLTTGR